MAASPPRRFWSPLLVVCAAVLLAAAVGMPRALAALIAHYSKEPIDLRLSLTEFPTGGLPSFRHIPHDGSVQIIADTESIGTEDWLYHRFEPRADKNMWPIGLLITYYSDPRDSIPHTPEVCYRQSGAVVDSIETIVIETPELAPEYPTIEARLLEIDQRRYRTTVAYVICCNGKMYSGREAARWALAFPGDKYVYFSKVEAVAHRPLGLDRETQVEQCKQLLREALPVLVHQHFPAAEDLRRREE